MFDVLSTDEYNEWYLQQDLDCRKIILEKVILLKQFGYNLNRPHADTLKGSTYSNLKELRVKNEKHVIRVSYVFDKTRKAFLLIGGDKKGKNEEDFYLELIKKSEELIKKYNLR